MKIKVADLRKLIREALLLEYTLSNDVTLYHRSPQKFKVGDILTAQTDPATGKHWLEKKQYEREMEDYRKKNHPNLPSRLNCIFSSFHPRSRFIGKGRLYAVKPIGKIHIVDSKIIDQLGRNSWKDNDWGYDSSLIEEYWQGTEPRRGNLADMEILSDSAEVLEVLDEPKRLMRGAKIVFSAGAPTIKGELTLNTSKDETKEPYAYASDGNTQVPEKEARRRLDIPGIKLGEPKKSSWGFKLDVEIGPGFSGVISTYRGEDPSSMKKDKEYSSYSVPTIGLSPGENIDKGGIAIHLDSPAGMSFFKAFRSGRIGRRD